MKRKIVGFHVDDEGDWVADLECFHGCHTRHRPPLVSRPWVTSEAGRESKIGAELDCVRCDRLELPDGLEFTHRSPEFDQDSTPPRLLSSHATQSGVWGVLRIVAGHLVYWVDVDGGREVHLAEGESSVIVSQMTHRLVLDQPVRFFIEFYRRPGTE